MIKIDELWPGGPRFIDDDSIFRPGTDSVLLAHYARSTALKKKKRMIDLGCGSGLISVLYAWDNPDSTVDGIDIQPNAARLASENLRLNEFGGRANVIEGDLRRHRELLKAEFYDIVISNPPYYSCGRGKRPVDPGLAAARTDDLCTLEDVCRAAGYLTRRGGSFLLVNKPERLVEIFRILTSYGLEPKRLRFVSHMPLSPPTLALIESRRGGRSSLFIEAPLILKNEDGSDTNEADLIYRRKN